MRIHILKNISGTGSSVAGFHHDFSLDPGMVADVDDQVARGWIASGVARAVEPEPETATIAAPERAVLRKRPIAPRPVAGKKGPRS